MAEAVQELGLATVLLTQLGLGAFRFVGRWVPRRGVLLVADRDATGATQTDISANLVKMYMGGSSFLEVGLSNIDFLF